MLGDCCFASAVDVDGNCVGSWCDLTVMAWADGLVSGTAAERWCDVEGFE